LFASLEKGGNKLEKEYRVTNPKEIFCRRCKCKLGVADHNDFYPGDDFHSLLFRGPSKDRIIVCSVCGWKRMWNFANNPKSEEKRVVKSVSGSNKIMYGRKTLSDARRGWLEEYKRLSDELKRRNEIEDDWTELYVVVKAISD
jgi:hypothetical protein